MSLDIFKNEGTSEKGCIEKNWGKDEKIEASLYTLDWGLKIVPFTLDTYVLAAKTLQNGA